MDKTHFDQAVHIVDDDELVRDSLEMLLDSVGLTCRAYASAPEFFENFDGVPGVVLLDVRMPGMSGLEMQEKLNEAPYAGLSVVFMSGHGDIPMAVEALKRGASDFLTKPFRHQELLDCLHRTLEKNEQDMERSLTVDAIAERLATLTPREQEVMAMIAEGKPNKIVAMDLNISQRTVEIHRARVMQKMGSASLAHLVRTLDAVQFFDHA